MLDPSLSPRRIVQQLDEYVVGQDEAKRTVAVAVWTHFRKIARSRAKGLPLEKSNVLLIGASGTGKTLMCDTLSRILNVPFVTAEATSLAQTRFVNDEIEAIMQRLVDKAGGDAAHAGLGIVFIDEIDKLKTTGKDVRAVSGESVQHALLKLMEGAQVRLADGRYVDTTNVLFICGGAFVGLEAILKDTHGYGFIATTNQESRAILARLNSRVKPTDLFAFGLIPEFTGRIPVVARFADLDKAKLVRIMTEPRNALYAQFRDLFAAEGVELVVEPRVFEQIAEVALEYKTGARSLRGIFEELMSPVLFELPERAGTSRVTFASLFAEPAWQP
ncbi:MAG TPA: AAA family ATPase [Casimicrobiaceae bacterium]|nr:AAA family ATPase [Casimicrobiaceae bacterium]